MPDHAGIMTFRRGSIAMLALVAAAWPAGAQEFRWIDSQGQSRVARKPEDVPRHDWSAVTMGVRGAEATSGERFRTAEGVTVVIEGIQAPSLDDDGTVVSAGGAAARARLEQLVRDVSLTLEFEGDRRLPDGAYLAHPVRDDGTLIAQTLLAEGMARLCLEEDARRHAAVLRAAQAEAQAAQAGVWARVPAARPPEPRTLRGISLGLFAQSPDFDYSGFLDEIRTIGATHLLLSSPWLMEDWQSNDFGPVKGRTAGWAAVQRVTRQARERGFAVAYLPLVLLRTGTVEHWRGDIQPTQRWLWFRNYNRYMGQWADVARDLGVSLLSVGSEFTSLERETSAWRGVIANVRTRFGGSLTYSANWDHLDVLGFWDDLDVVGTTGYHSLTSKHNPTVEELTAAWAPIKDKMLRFQTSVGKPIVFTEIGYPSQDGANKDPWNYFINTGVPDHHEQADCFRALFTAWKDAPAGFGGMYIWNWWRHEEPNVDVGYSVWGKPAYAEVKGYFDAIAAREASGELRSPRTQGTNGGSGASSRPRDGR
jgi:endonuclease YncB( thermonuclease family)